MAGATVSVTQLVVVTRTVVVSVTEEDDGGGVTEGDNGVCVNEGGNGCVAEKDDENDCVGSERTLYISDPESIMIVAAESVLDDPTSAVRELETSTAETIVERPKAAPFVQRICTSVASSGAEYTHSKANAASAMTFEAIVEPKRHQHIECESRFHSPQRVHPMNS